MVNFIKTFFARYLSNNDVVDPAIAINPPATHVVQPAPPSSPLPTSTATVATRISSPTISIMNASTVLTDAQVQTALAALQIQLDRDFSPVWGISATLQFLPKSTPLPVHHWLITLMDNSDQQGALGYHDLTANGLPVAKIFAKDDLKYGLSWTVTLSHELLELLVDPYITNCSFAQTSNTEGILYAYEVSDACEDDSCGYKINGVLVSDFVYPAWFEGFRLPGSTKFDFTDKISRPFQLAPGGYISRFVVGAGSQGWTQITANTVPTQRNQKGVESRMANRRNARKPDLIKLNKKMHLSK